MSDEELDKPGDDPDEDSYWHPQVMRHRGPGGSYEYAMHDVYFDSKGRVEGYTREARSPRFPSPQELRTWILDNLTAAEQGIVCGDLGYKHYDYDLVLWLRHVDQPPLDYSSESA
jgi:hypothetical protein